MKDTQTLCWDCRNAVNGCNWSMEGKPVDGWTAEATTLKTKSGQTANSYCVIKCPEFVPDRKGQK